ncbi:hypothetical protein LUZ62_024591 [Rhynchospora pubera]|uniref:Uncharacterized protein n=1 Tax=Rhynchospora pubera TaxID=906938 RepID=A0AAV8H7U7_9POAL|nr:hypothetical protein LUZ62_024591 [Rhynchospora pubera]
MEEEQHVAIDMHAPTGIMEEIKIDMTSAEITRAEEEDVATDKLQNFIKKLGEVPGEPFEAWPVTICRLPAWFHDYDKELCEPKIVSIGPYHRGKESLQAMEEHKWSILRDFLARNKNVSFEVYFREMRLLEAQARQCYSETVSLGSNDFVMMLLLDGSFILEWPPKLSCSEIHHWLHLCRTGVLPDIQFEREQRDLLTGKSYFRALNKLPWSKFLLKSRDVKSTSSEGPEGINIPCVTELDEAGVKFRRKREPRDMFDISFQNGILEMPFVPIDDGLKILLWNMVAFEQSQPAIPLREKTLSSYLGLMDSLINTEKDVAILVRSGIIGNYLQNDEQVANFFNQFGLLFVLDYNDHYLHGLYKDVKRYSESTWHKYRARLMHDYFSNPWSIISVVAAIILLILSFLQTYYSAAK